MYTTQQVADYINTNKPDFKDFKALFDSSSMEFYKIKNNIDLTKSMEEKLFKTQILACFYKTHNNYWLSGEVELFLGKTLHDNLTGSKVLARTGTYAGYSFDSIYYVQEGLEINNSLILAHVLDIQNYLPKYLWNKVRTKTAVTDIKKLEPNEFSLTTFKIYLQNLKKELSSTKAIEYIKQIGKFNDIDIKEKFIEVLNEHLTQPSIELQKELSSIVNSTYNLTKKTKYISLNRYPIKGLASKSQILVNESVLDSSDSQYKPYITNIKRKPTTDIREFTALVGTLLIFKASIKSNPNEGHQYFAECLMEHLKEPGYEQVRKEYTQTLKNTKEVIEEILNGFI